MGSSPPSLRTRSAVGHYLADLARGLLCVVVPASRSLEPSRIESARAAAAVSPGLGRAQRIARALTLLLSGVCVWVLFGGGGAFDLAGHEVSLRSLRNPARLAMTSGAVWFVLHDLRSGRWSLPRRLNTLGRLRTSTRAGVVLWCVVLLRLTSTAQRVGECLDVQAGRQAGANGSTLFSNEWHQHLRPLVDHLARRAREPELALYIEDVNPRGHLDAFYAYPRLLRMEPAQHAWTLAEMMGRGAELDPGFARPGARPDLRETLEWAAGRGLEVLIARPEGVEVVAVRGER